MFDETCPSLRSTTSTLSFCGEHSSALSLGLNPALRTAPVMALNPALRAPPPRRMFCQSQIAVFDETYLFFFDERHPSTLPCGEHSFVSFESCAKPVTVKLSAHHSSCRRSPRRLGMIWTSYFISVLRSFVRNEQHIHACRSPEASLKRSITPQSLSSSYA